MNAMLFLIVCLVVHSIPIPFDRDMLRPAALLRWLPSRLIWGAVAWFLICVIFGMTIPWALLTLVMSFALLFLFSSGFRARKFFGQGIHRLSWSGVCVAFLVVLIVPTASSLIVWTSDVSNAQSVNEFIVEADGPLFENPIADDQVRLVTDTLAEFVARQYMSQIGSNVEIAASHITTRDGRLVWVCVIVSTNVLAENYIQGFIVVDANEPTDVEVIDNVDFAIGEGLFWDRNIQLGNYLQDMTNAYQYAYPTWDPVGNLVYIQTRTQLGLDFVERPLGPKVFCHNGTVVTYNTLAETPIWITQAYSEEWLERQINRWGGYRRGTGFDLFAGGLLWFIQPSRDRMEMTEDTRYIINPDTNRVEALITLHPPDSTSLTLSGIIRATKDQIYFYDMKNATLISGVAATNEVIKNFTQPVTGSYYGGMPLIYPVQINSTYTRQAWYCPIYWYNSEYSAEYEDYTVTDVRLHALAIVDGEHWELSGIEVKGAKGSAELVQITREKYVDAVEAFFNIQPEPTQELILTASVTNVTSYVEGGNTHIVLRTDNSTYEWIEGARAWMNTTDWYTLLTIEVGDMFTASLGEVDGVFRIVAFVKL